jgi:hypothetical protein
MGRFMKNFRKKIEERIENAVNEATGGGGGGGGGSKMNQVEAQKAFENDKPDSMRKDVRMISGCDDTQTSADVSNVNSFSLPDPAGRAGGACTSTLLNILYKDELIPDDTMSFTEVLEKMRTNLKENGYSQIPQLTSLNPIDITTDFQLVPEDTTGGVRRAVMIGINYVGHEQGELSGCHNDVLNMVRCIYDVDRCCCCCSFIVIDSIRYSIRFVIRFVFNIHIISHKNSNPLRFYIFFSSVSLPLHTPLVK